MASNKLQQKVIDNYVSDIQKIKDEVEKLVIGQRGTVDALIRGFLCDGHILVEGIPGIAKTVLIRALAMASGCQFSRIQFTVDLLPTDIVGVTSYDPHKGFYVMKGPIFANFVLADEINRSPPKTQSAMLEAMQEKIVTIGKQEFPLMLPFFVMATQNPIERGGVFPLPEAQLDRFLFKLFMGYPKFKDELKILDKNITIHKMEDFDIKPATNPQKIIEMQEATHKVYMDEAIRDYLVKIVDASRNPGNYGVKTGKYIGFGGSPRASIGLFIGAKSSALMHGRNFATPQDVKDVAMDVMNHRVMVNYDGRAEGVESKDIIEEILKKVPVP